MIEEIEGDLEELFDLLLIARTIAVVDMTGPEWPQQVDR